VRKKKRTAKPYTKGELNRLIDGLCHPLFRTDAGYIFVDGILHGLVERDPELSIRKFVKYNLPTLIKQMEKKTRQNNLKKTKKDKS